jgi:peptidoglycan/LPS O-acetylase OafA/YrhL/lysophospholipase L1-like esterase
VTQSVLRPWLDRAPHLRGALPSNTRAKVASDCHPVYVPALDGIRALAVGAVVAYHVQLPGFGGGLLGVSVFFTLSGYLITALLLREFVQHGRVDMTTFWLRRARRLLPALVFMLAVVVLTTAIARPGSLLATLRQALCALIYVANWTTIARGDDYFQRLGGPGPLDHLWSLAIEEQFYLVWPLVVLGLLALGARTRRGLGPLALVTVVVACASTWAIGHAYDPNAVNNTRAYEGTDCRAAALLVGALAALVLPFHRAAVALPSRRARIAIDLLGAVGLAGVALCIARTDESSAFLYTGGEVLLATATAFVAIAASHPETRVARALRAAPLRWVGARSYGVYLWHLPVVALMPEAAFAGAPLARAVVQIALILVLAAASYRLIEEPMRRQSPASRRGALILLPLATFALVLWALSCRPSKALTSEGSIAPLEATAEPDGTGSTTLPASATSPVPAPMPVPDAQGEPAPKTSCREVLHVGDSTSIGLVSNQILPNVDDQIGARYRALGVERFLPEIAGARSMVETYKDQPNATHVVRQMRMSGYAGCVVLALGTNDSANTAGNVAALETRMDAMMAIIGPDLPVLWTTTKTLHDRGPYQNAHMQSWTQALTDVCARHPKMRVYDWASEVHDDWFGSDGIHYGRAGYRERAARIARALARAFPKDGTSPAGCFVGSG